MNAFADCVKAVAPASPWTTRGGERTKPSPLSLVEKAMIETP